jgi:hypothetical protein
VGNQLNLFDYVNLVAIIYHNNYSAYLKIALEILSSLYYTIYYRHKIPKIGWNGDLNQEYQIKFRCNFEIKGVWKTN